jgi:hypoxanthine phosphoribosyltransferase
MKPDVIPYSWPVVHYMYDYLYQQIVESEWIPDTILMVLRGGAFVGGALYERFRKDKKISYGAIAVSSYNQECQQAKLECFGCTWQAGQLPHNSKVLIADDIFDTGATLQFVSDYLSTSFSPTIEARIAVLDYKDKEYLSQPKLIPHYYARKFIIKTPAEDVWIDYPFFTSRA